MSAALPEGQALRDSIFSADTRANGKPKASEQDKLDAALARKMRSFIALSDAREEARRADDRIGGNLLFSNHWNVRMGRRRAALTINVARALLDDKIALMTKSRPIPVVESVDVGDEEGVRLMRAILMQWWDDQDMDRKLEHALYLANATRTSAIKIAWDPAENAGAGGITAGVLPGWRLVIDPRASDRKRVAFGGDRTVMPRSRAMLFYPKAADKIKEAQSATSDVQSGGAATGRGSPLDDQFSTKAGAGGPGVLTVNGTPTLTAEGSVEVGARESKELVEVCEIYWRDSQMVEREVPKTHPQTGEVLRKPRIGEDGLPVFRQTTSTHVDVDGTQIELPAFELELEDETEIKLAPKYPWWRRTTMLLPDGLIVDDKAWDFPYPYSYFLDGQPLEGLWYRGTFYELRGLQTDFNVGVSICTDNMRFGSMRAGVVYDGADLEQNVLSISPGDVLRVRGPKGTFEWIEFPKLDQSWFQKFEFNVSMMRLLLGLDGVMSGQAQGRVDSSSAYDTLADISGARIAKCGARMERSVADLMQIVGSIAQESYTEKHAVRVERASGTPTYERITPASLRGQFRFKVVMGSSLAWNESGKRQQLQADFAAGLIDKIGYWQALNYPDWQNINARMKAEGPQNLPPPPKPPPKPKAPKKK